MLVSWIVVSSLVLAPVEDVSTEVSTRAEPVAEGTAEGEPESPTEGAAPMEAEAVAPTPPAEAEAVAPTSPTEAELDRARWAERDRLLLDGTVALSVLTAIGVASAIAGAVLIGSAGTDPEHCGDIETPPCESSFKNRVGGLLLISGFVVTLPSAAGLGVVVKRWRSHRRDAPPSEARLGPGSLVLRF